jgi:hypothetical protein
MIGKKPLQRQWPALPAWRCPRSRGGLPPPANEALPKKTAFLSSITACSWVYSQSVSCAQVHFTKLNMRRARILFSQTLSAGSVMPPPPPRTGGAPAVAPVLALGWGAVLPLLLRGAVVTPLPPAVARAPAVLPVLLLPPVGGLGPAAPPLPLHAQAAAR